MWSSSSDQILNSTQKPKLRKCFKLLKSHACKVANFTLQWQELEEHLRFIHSQIESKLQNNPATETVVRTESQKGSNPRSKDLFLSQNEDPERETEDEDETGKRTTEVPVKNGKELIFYVKEHVSNRELLQDYLFKLFEDVDEPGKLVLEALEEFYPDGFCKGHVDTGIRRSCVVLLEEFGKVRERVDDVAGVREEAKRMAVKWRGMMKLDNSLEVLGFLQLLIAFGLVGEFAFDEILKPFDCVLKMRQAPELFRALGFADKAPDYIQRLIRRNRRLEAVKFVYAFDLVNQFPPVPLLKDHAKYAKKVSKNIRRKGNNLRKAQADASKREIAALRGIVKFINNYQLGSEYSTEILRNQIQQRKGRKANTKITGSNAQSQQNDRNKRTAPSPKSQQNQQKRNKCIQMAEPKASLNTSPSIYSKQPPHHQPACSFSGQGAEYSSPSAGTAVPSQSAPYTYVGAASNSRLQLSLPQAAHILTGARHLTPYFGNYHGASSTSVTVNLYTSSAALPYELSGSATIRPHSSSSPRLYERGSIATNGLSGQFGFTTTHTHMANASNASPNVSFPYYRGELPRTSVYYNRQISSSSVGIAPNTSFNNTLGY